MQSARDYWRCEAVPDGPPKFPFAIVSSGEVVAWVKRPVDAAFIATARDELRQLALELTFRERGQKR
jgi:hypothetical protein